MQFNINTLKVRAGTKVSGAYARGGRKAVDLEVYVLAVAVVDNQPRLLCVRDPGDVSDRALQFLYAESFIFAEATEWAVPAEFTTESLYVTSGRQSLNNYVQTLVDPRRIAKSIAILGSVKFTDLEAEEVAISLVEEV